MTPESLRTDNNPSDSFSDNVIEDHLESGDENHELSVGARVLAKRQFDAHWSIVGRSHFHFPPTYDIKVSLPNGREKWIGVSLHEFEALNENEMISIPVRPWEREEYVLKLKAVFNNAGSIDDLKVGLLAMDLEDEHQTFSVDEIVEVLDNIEQGANVNAAIAFLPDVSGLKERLLALMAARKGSETVESTDPAQMSDLDLVKTYQALQDRVSGLITKRDSLLGSVAKARNAKESLQELQERIQARIEEAFVILGNYREIIDRRKLQAKPLGERSR
jgi:hypothetical protein